jgi:hypothetical protein
MVGNAMPEDVLLGLDFLEQPNAAKTVSIIAPAARTTLREFLTLDKMTSQGAHESPHFCATLKSPNLGFPRAAGWSITREGELCARRRNDLISFMNS